MKLENFDDIDGIVTSIMNSSTTEFEFSTSWLYLDRLLIILSCFKMKSVFKKVQFLELSKKSIDPSP